MFNKTTHRKYTETHIILKIPTFISKKDIIPFYGIIKKYHL